MPAQPNNANSPMQQNYTPLRSINFQNALLRNILMKLGADTLPPLDVQLPESAKLSFYLAHAIHNNAPANDILAIYQSIEHPGSVITRHVFRYLWERRQAIDTAELLMQLNLSQLSQAQINHTISYLYSLNRMDRIRTYFTKLENAFPDRQDLYTKTAWSLFAPHNQWQDCIEWIQRDLGQGRLSANGYVRYAQALAAHQQHRKASQVIKKAYQLHPNFNSLHATVASKYPPLRHRLQYQLAAYRRDANNQKLPPDQQLRQLALEAASGNETFARHAATELARQNPSLAPVFAQIGWLAFMKTACPDRAIPWFALDSDILPQYPEWMHNHAIAMAGAGTHPSKIPQLPLTSPPPDYHARIALQYSMLYKFSPELVIAAHDLDQEQDLITSNGMLSKIIHRAALTPADSISSAIEACYRQDPALRNGYTRAAWNSFIAGLISPDKMIEFIERDKRAKRLTPQASVLEAVTLAHQGQAAKAWQLVANAYAKNSAIHAGFPLVATVLFLRNHDLSTLNTHDLAKDATLSRLPNAAIQLTFSCLAQALNLHVPIDYITRLAARTGIAPVLARNWLSRSGIHTEAIDNLLTPDNLSLYNQYRQEHPCT